MSRSSKVYFAIYRAEARKGVPRRVPVGPAQARVRTLLRLGAHVSAIADCSGVSKPTIARLRDGRGPELINRVMAECILRVRYDDLFERSNPEVFVPKVGTVRRIRALMALGYTSDEIGHAGGITGKAVNNAVGQPGRWVSRAKADAVARAYTQLSDRQATGPSAENIRGRARARGFVPPIWWDEDTIDDPQASATPSHQKRPGGKRLWVEDIEFLVCEAGVGRAEIQHRLGVKWSGIEQACLRADRHDLLDRMRENDVSDQEVA